MQDKIAGMLFGIALGDALGAPHEFRQSIPVTQYTGYLEYPPLSISFSREPLWSYRISYP